MSFDTCRWVWMNGSIVPWENANFHVSSHALHYGTGVFEGIRCYETYAGPSVFRLDAHVERFFASAAVYGTTIPYSAKQLDEAVCELIRINGYKSCYVRPICFRGSGDLHLNPRGCPVQVVILAWPWAQYLDPGGNSKGVRVCTSPWRKFQSEMIPATAKATGQYVNSVLATSDAQRRGYDEGLLLNADGSIAEGAGENLFVVTNKRLITNGERDSILMGITRDTVLTIAADRGYSTEVRTMSVDDLFSADEAFFTGTATEIAAISEVDNQSIGDGAPGRITIELQREFRSITSGQNEHYAQWLRPVAPESVMDASK